MKEEMTLNQTLTKENFWNRMMEQYPHATTAFCKWVDEYKKAVNWDKLFNHGITHHVSGSAFKSTTSAPKFHDLPHAMQMGIWIEYISQRGGCQWEIEDMFQYDLSEDIEGFFRELLEDEAKNDAETDSTSSQLA